MRRRAELVGIHQEAEALAGFLLGKAEGMEHTILQGGVVDTHRAAAHLNTVQHNVVGHSVAGTGVALHLVQVLGLGQGERMVHGHPAAFLLAVLKQREVHDPQEVELVGVDQAVLAGDVQADLAQGGAGLDPIGVADQQQHVAGLGVQGGVQGGLLGIGQELLEAGGSAIGGQAAVSQALGTVGLGDLAQLVNILAGQLVGQALGVDGADGTASFQHSGKGLELGALEHLGHVLDLQAKAGIRLIGAEAAHGLVPGHADEGGLHVDVQHLFPQALDQTLVDGHDVVLGDEAHLLVHLGELGLAVSAQVLVAVAAGDLEVAVEAGQHQDLLVKLRALGQGVEVTGLHTAGHQIVTGTLRGRLDEGRGLDLAEVILAEIIADDLHDLAAQHDRLMHRGATQVQVAVAQAQVIVDVDLIAQLKRRGLGLAQDTQFADVQFHITGGDLVGLGGALTQFAAADHHVFTFQAFGFGENVFWRILVKNQLQDAGGIAQIGKDDAALIAGTGDRTADGHLLPGIGQADLAAVIGTAQGPHRFHSSSPLYIIRQRAGAGRRILSDILLYRAPPHLARGVHRDLPDKTKNRLKRNASSGFWCARRNSNPGPSD